MASLLIRKLDDTLHARLKARALQHGRSLEEEVRETLRLALARDASTQEPVSLMRIAAQVFGPGRSIDLPLPDFPLPDRALDTDRAPPRPWPPPARPVILLDTTVVSEIMKPWPHPHVAAFIDARPIGRLFVPSLVIAELRHAIARLPQRQRCGKLTPN